MFRIAPLNSFGRADIATAGGKAANLGELTRAGFPVPDGFVITTAAYDEYLATHHLRSELACARTGEQARALFDRPIPEDLADAIRVAYHDLGAGPVAVRSSATAEDLEDASFAGQQDTYLNIEGTAALLDAVRRCWASLWTDRAISYRSHAGVRDASLAVVIQRLVDADAAGIMFTANPANGRRRETAINASFGLGEAVVGGEVTPDEMVVADARVTSRTTADKTVRTVTTPDGTATEPTLEEQRHAPVLTEAQAVALADLGRRIERHFGAPQDIEWTLTDDGFQIVQARPITALPDEIGPVPTEWPLERRDGMYIRASIVEQLPDPLSPLFADLIRPSVAASLRTVLQRYFKDGVLEPDDMDFPTVNGFAYYFYSNAGMWRLMKASPTAMPVVFKPGSDLNGVTMWRNVGLPAYREVVDRWRDVDPASLAATRLLEAASELISAGAEYYTFVQALIPQSASAEIAFTKLYEATVRHPGRPPALTFLLGAESEPIRAERSIYRIAQWCRRYPDVVSALAAEHAVPASRRTQFDGLLREHLDRFGHLTYNLDIMQPVAADDPSAVMVALRYAVSGQATDPDERLARLRADRDSATEWLWGHVGPVRRAPLESTLAKAQELGPLREDALADVGLGWPAARRMLRELGRRFAEAGFIDTPDDVFWLTVDEVRGAAAALDDGRGVGPSASAAVTGRKVQWRGRRQVATPPGWLPAGGLFHRMFRRFMPSNEAPQDGDTLKGLGASGGTAHGPARLLRGPEDFPTMRPGDVLVAPITTPAYTPFFAMASAVVTDVGGPLSHSSIVAREYGIPAVLGTGSATARIHNGDELTVDGDRGVVLLPTAG